MNANYLGSHFIRKIEELLADNRHGVVLDLGRNTRQADRARGEEIAHLVKRLCNFVQGDLAGRLPEVGINGDADNAIKGQKGASTLLNDRGIDLALRNNISRLGIESRIVPDAFSKVSEGLTMSLKDLTCALLPRTSPSKNCVTGRRSMAARAGLDSLRFKKTGRKTVDMDCFITSP